MAVGVQPRGSAAADQHPTALAQRAVTFARSVIGVPYLWGGVTPNGFDCSGLCEWAYKQAGLTIPRTSSEQAHAGYPSVPVSQLAPGDLVFSDWPGDAGPSPGHVVLYAGGGECIAAPHTGTTVQLEKLDVFLGAPYRGSVRPSGAVSGHVPTPAGGGAGGQTPPAKSSGVAGAAAGLGVGLGVVILAAAAIGTVVVVIVFRHLRRGGPVLEAARAAGRAVQ